MHFMLYEEVNHRHEGKEESATAEVRGAGDWKLCKRTCAQLYAFMR